MSKLIDKLQGFSMGPNHFCQQENLSHSPILLSECWFCCGQKRLKVTISQHNSGWASGVWALSMEWRVCGTTIELSGTSPAHLWSPILSYTLHLSCSGSGSGSSSWEGRVVPVAHSIGVAANHSLLLGWLLPRAQYWQATPLPVLTLVSAW